MESCLECDTIEVEKYGHKPFCKGEAMELNDQWLGGSTNIRPTYYAKYPIDPWTFCIKNKLTLDVGSVIKYVVRHQDKNGVEDLNKAIKCIEMMKEHYYNEKS